MTKIFDRDFDNPTDCQLIFAVNGTCTQIKEKLQDLIDEINNPNYNKPIQGINFWCGSVSSVTTPIWNGKNYY